MSIGMSIGMRSGRSIAIALAAALAGIALGYLAAPRHAGDPLPRTAPGAAGAAQDGREILYWHDPMVPDVKFDKPGKSPFMDMQLVPVYADEAGDGGVRVNPALRQNLGIRLGTVERKVLQHRLSAVGSVAFDERLLEIVQARVAGNVTRLYVKAPLEQVRRGQPLAEVLAPEWLAAQQDYLAMLDAGAASQGIREAARQRLVVLGVPQATIETIEEQRTVAAATTLHAPIDGVIAELSVRQGSAFAAGESLMRLNGLATVWVNAQIPEAQVSSVPVGSSAHARATAWPGLTFDGHVIAVLPQVDPQTRTLNVRLAIDNSQGRLAPGMFISLDFAGPPSQPQLVVPSEAIIVTGTRSVAIVVRADGSFAVADVKIGSEADGVSTVLAGLEEGQSVVLSGQFLIDSEASLRSTVERLTAPTSQVKP